MTRRGASSQGTTGLPGNCTNADLVLVGTQGRPFPASRKWSARLRAHASLSGIAKLSLLLCLLLAGSSLWAEPTAEEEQARAEAIWEALAGPVFSGPERSGGELHRADLEGKVLLVDFWGTFCKPCIEALPFLRRLAKRHSEKPFHLLSVSVDADPEVLRAFLVENDIQWTQIWDGKGALARAFAVRSFPTYILVDHQGRARVLQRGHSSAVERKISSEVSRALGKAKRARKKEARLAAAETPPP